VPAELEAARIWTKVMMNPESLNLCRAVLFILAIDETPYPYLQTLIT